MTAGSIEGGGIFQLGSKQLTVGSNNLSTTVSGVIADTGGGSLVKTGTGILALSGTNTYTGDDGERRRASRERLDRIVEPDHGE
jgi:hypothetical protein